MHTPASSVVKGWDLSPIHRVLEMCPARFRKHGKVPTGTARKIKHSRTRIQRKKVLLCIFVVKVIAPHEIIWTPPFIVQCKSKL